jgi:hypothetical protein
MSHSKRKPFFICLFSTCFFASHAVNHCQMIRQIQSEGKQSARLMSFLARVVVIAVVQAFFFAVGYKDVIIISQFDISRQ